MAHSHHDHNHDHHHDESHVRIIRIVATAILLTIAYIVTKNVSMPLWVQLLVYLVPYILISYDVMGEAVEGIASGNPFDEDFLMFIATLGALAIGFIPGAEPEFLESVFVMLFFQVGELFEGYAEGKSRDSIEELMDIRPDAACVERGGGLQVVAPQEVAIGETLVVKPGEKIALDGVVLEGQSALNTVALTGESLPREVTVGDEVISGCVNISGLLRITVSKSFGESTVSKILRLVAESADNKSRSETFIHRFAKVYTPIVVCLAVLLALVPPIFCSSYITGLATWGYRALAFLVVSCPCALVLSVPLTFFAGIGGASRQGILIKGGNYMEALSRAEIVVMDKTGTLTKGVFLVDTVHPASVSADQLLYVAASAEQFSTHPIAQALRQACTTPLHEEDLTDVQEVAGQGIRVRLKDKSVSVGNEKLMLSMGISMPKDKEYQSHVGTIIHVAIDSQYAGHIVISDSLKDDAVEAIQTMKALGVHRTIMLTGDNEAAASAVAHTLAVDEYHASLLPADKVDHVERLMQEKSSRRSSLVFVGDGINDAPVLARADVGIAMGALGSDAAIEASDVVLMDDKPSKIASAIRICRHTIAIAMQNTYFAVGIKVAILILVAIGVLGNLAMPIAVFGDVGVMVLAVLNAMRALRIH